MKFSELWARRTEPEGVGVPVCGRVGVSELARALLLVLGRDIL
jgi:hypothetical protein